jgi:hypothetical protein
LLREFVGEVSLAGHGKKGIGESARRFASSSRWQRSFLGSELGLNAIYEIRLEKRFV